MSSCSSSVPQHRVQMSVLLSTLLLSSQDATRVWLRAEMDRLVDPMLDSIFNRLTNKLANADLDQEGTDGERSQANPSDHVESPQMHHSTTLIPQPSNSYLDFHQPHSIGYEPEFDPEILAQVKREIKEEQNEMELKKVMDNEQNQKSNEQSNHNLTNLEDEKEENQFNQVNTQQLGDDTNNGEMMQIEEKDDETEIDSENDVELKDNQNDEDSEASRPVINTSRINATPPPNKRSRVITRQSAKFIKRKQTEEVLQSQVVNDTLDNLEDTEEEEDEVISRSVKRPRPSSRPTTSNCNTKQTKQILTRTLQCPQVNCPSVFTQDKQLTAHMWNRHSIRPFRCMVKDCNQSFSHKKFLGEHIAQSHQSISSQWHCDKCGKHYTTYSILSVHNVEHHQLGHFQCSFPSCTFTGEYRKKVYDHYTTKHRQQTLKCQHCPYETQNSSNLNQHLRVHLKSKPYKCKWSKCKYTSTTSSHISRHIRAIHLVAKPDSVPNGAQLNPKDYVEAVQ